VNEQLRFSSYTFVLRHVLTEFTEFVLDERRICSDTKLPDFVLRHVLGYVVFCELCHRCVKTVLRLLIFKVFYQSDPIFTTSKLCRPSADIL